MGYRREELPAMADGRWNGHPSVRHPTSQPQPHNHDRFPPYCTPCTNGEDLRGTEEGSVGWRNRGGFGRQHAYRVSCLGSVVRFGSNCVARRSRHTLCFKRRLLHSFPSYAVRPASENLMFALSVRWHITICCLELQLRLP